jgi:hypothetical protein
VACVMTRSAARTSTTLPLLARLACLRPTAALLLKRLPGRLSGMARPSGPHNTVILLPTPSPPIAG